jgi:hypothetical protein
MEVTPSTDIPNCCYVDTSNVRFITLQWFEVFPIDRQSEGDVGVYQVWHPLDIASKSDV